MWELAAQKGNVLKLTVDSSEPLEDALRVVGALYGVTLVVSQDAGAASPRTEAPTAKPKKRSLGAKPRTRKGSATTGSGSRTRSAGSAGVASTADVRSWARHTGLAVSSRGRVPA